ncbi:5-oxoprolinase subunit PxpA [Winogradskyella luteola]|uniref:5-oxoprolinase subunit PxpA n=1 Tax=Winogradskyella luteola TaxID=2828330 RepID=A0A9X1FCJ9_9FLAO|nr:5-oxoprolinase subunit PxpA [Winogradskyella luteola]MBV7270498.1 5-oxoprolinase subunit PxpA [Winogradskyella luteola]
MEKQYKIVDINADVGEGLNNEPNLMPYLSSCNIACGGHAGNLETMTKVVRLAKKHSVKVGAHPSFPDKANFGRIVVDMIAADLYSSLKAQIRALQDVLYAESVQLHHIKPHGALYNLANRDEKAAKVIIEVIKSIALPLALYAPYRSVIAELATKAKINVIYEAFADRNYNNDLSLVSRKKDNAILSHTNEVLKHVLKMINQRKVISINGVEVEIKASTFCVHGDTKNALQILKYLNEELPKKGIKIQ